MFLSQMTALAERKINMLIQKKKKREKDGKNSTWGMVECLIKAIRSQMPVPDFNFK